MDALDVRELGERFDVVLCFGILHRVSDPIALLRALADVLAPGGEIVLETHGSRLAAGAPAIEVHEPGDVYARDEHVCWGFSPAGLRRLGLIVGLDEVEVVDQLEIDGHPRIVACCERPADPSCDPPRARRSGRLRRRGELVVQCRRSISGDRVDAERSGSRGQRGVVDRPGRDAKAIEPQALRHPQAALAGTSTVGAQRLRNKSPLHPRC